MVKMLKMMIEEDDEDEEALIAQVSLLLRWFFYLPNYN